MKGENKRFIEILKGELKDAPVSVRINIANKQKDLPAYTDKLVNVFRTIIANPQVLQNPATRGLIFALLELRGMSAADLGLLEQKFNMPQSQAPLPTGATIAGAQPNQVLNVTVPSSGT